MFRKKPSISERIKEAISPTPMKQKITQTLHRLSVQLKHLERKSHQLQSRDKELYKKCVAALQSKKNEMATMYANECAEIRKILMITIKSQLALEQVKIRLQTIKDFGEHAYLMGSVLSVIDGIKSQLVSILPNISNELSDIGETLQDMVVDIGDTMDQSVDTSTPSEEGNKILEEATAVAEQKMKETLPEIPSIPTKESKI